MKETLPMSDRSMDSSLFNVIVYTTVVSCVLTSKLTLSGEFGFWFSKGATNI